MLLARGFYTAGSKMTPRTQAGVDVTGSRVDAFETQFYVTMVNTCKSLLCLVFYFISGNLISSSQLKATVCICFS